MCIKETRFKRAIKRTRYQFPGARHQTRYRLHVFSLSHHPCQRLRCYRTHNGLSADLTRIVQAKKLFGMGPMPVIIRLIIHKNEHQKAHGNTNRQTKEGQQGETTVQQDVPKESLYEIKYAHDR